MWYERDDHDSSSKAEPPGPECFATNLRLCSKSSSKQNDGRRDVSKLTSGVMSQTSGSAYHASGPGDVESPSRRVCGPVAVSGRSHRAYTTTPPFPSARYSVRALTQTSDRRVCTRRVHEKESVAERVASHARSVRSNHDVVFVWRAFDVQSTYTRDYTARRVWSFRISYVL